MNEARACAEGLVFEGKVADVYDDEECREIREEAARIRKLGFRAVVVQSGQHEWGCGSKVLYVEKAYSDYKWFQDNLARSEGKREIIYAEEQCAKIMKEAYEKQARLDSRIEKIREELTAAGHGDLVRKVVAE